MSLLKVKESSFPVLSGDLISELNKVSRDNIFYIFLILCK